jgi:hypothetical protein
VNLSRLCRLSAVFALLFLFTFGCAAQPSATRSPTAAPPTSASDNPTAGAIARATRQAQATRNSQATQAPLASQTAAAAAKATQTANAQAAATSTAAAQATLQAIYAAEHTWPQRLHEPFNDNQLGWPTGLTQDQYLAVTSTVAGGRYRWLAAIASSGAYTNLVPAKGPLLGDFYAAVTVQFVQGNDDGQSAYGLAFRLVNEDFGFFGIQKSGSFLVLEVHQSNIDQQLDSGTSAINTGPGATNQISVVGIGSDFVFLINDQEVSEMSANISPGQIGLGVEAFAGAKEAQVDFSAFEVRAP